MAVKFEVLNILLRVTICCNWTRNEDFCNERHKVEVTGEENEEVHLYQQWMTLKSYFKVVHYNLCFMNFLSALKHPQFPDHVHLWSLEFQYHETVTWDKNTKVHPKNEPNFLNSLVRSSFSLVHWNSLYTGNTLCKLMINKHEKAFVFVFSGMMSMSLAESC